MPCPACRSGRPTAVFAAFFTLLAGSLIFVTSPASAQLTIGRWTVDGGGSPPAQGGGYQVYGTIGQPDAGVLTGGAYTLGGGFWGTSAGVVVGVADDSTGSGPGSPLAPPLTLRVLAPQPNPVSLRTQITFELPEPLEVEIGIFDIQGGLVRNLTSGTMPAGRHSLEWDVQGESRSRVGSGVYFVRVRLGHAVKSHRLVVIR